MTLPPRPTDVNNTPFTTDMPKVMLLVVHERSVKRLPEGEAERYLRSVVGADLSAARAATREAEAKLAALPTMVQSAISAMGATVTEGTDAAFAPTVAMNATIRILSHATGVAVTLPNNLPKGFTMGMIQGGEGQLTFAAAAGASMRHVDDATKSRKIDAYVSLLVSKNVDGQSAEWRLLGDMEIP